MSAPFTEWQPIETAPIDVFVFGFCPKPRHNAWETAPYLICKGERKTARHKARFFDGDGYPVAPTHWMPLPEAPVTNKQGEA